ncbi:MAG: efflux RND transporter periplasmic adaptor subunit [Bryobacteraceae bacterium]
MQRFMISLAVLASMGVGCAKRQEKDPRTLPELVRITSASTSSRSNQLFTGVVTARVQSDLGFRVSGKITQRLVDAGETVRAGQPLMRIDNTDYAHAITAQTESVAAAKARADQASADEARYRGLVATGAISASTYDQIKAASDTARAQLTAAEAQEKIARDQGDYSVLLADADGTVVETLAEPGQVVSPGQTVVRLAHGGPREASVFLPETTRPRLGSVARATLFGRSGSVSARLRQLSDSADPLTRTFEARYVLGSVGAEAPLGATATIQLTGSGTEESLTVPNAAITDRGSGPGVWILNRNNLTVSFRPVAISRIGEEDTYLNSGLKRGEEIVALGAHLLHEGQQVRVDEHERQEIRLEKKELAQR